MYDSNDAQVGTYSLQPPWAFFDSSCSCIVIRAPKDYWLFKNYTVQVLASDGCAEAAAEFQLEIYNTPPRQAVEGKELRLDILLGVGGSLNFQIDSSLFVDADNDEI